jgi:hypothetical protein
MSMSDQHEAALARLVAAGELTEVQAAAVRREFAVAPQAARTGFLVEVAGYLGGGLILGAVALSLGNRGVGIAHRPASSPALLVAAPGASGRSQGARRRVVGCCWRWHPGGPAGGATAAHWRLGFRDRVCVAVLCLVACRMG